MDNTTEKKVYVQPSIEDHGKVADLTATGISTAGGDAKTGTSMSNGK